MRIWRLLIWFDFLLLINIFFLIIVDFWVRIEYVYKSFNCIWLLCWHYKNSTILSFFAESWALFWFIDLRSLHIIKDFVLHLMILNIICNNLWTIIYSIASQKCHNLSVFTGQDVLVNQLFERKTANYVVIKTKNMITITNIILVFG